MTPIATSKNLTILGCITIAGALVTAAAQFFQGGSFAAVNIEALVTAVGLGVGMIMSKGAQSTGGTVPQTQEAANRIGVPLPTGISGAAAKVIGPSVLLVLAIGMTGCSAVSALQGSTGPITITTAKDPTTGAVVATSSVNLTAGPARVVGGACLKPVSAVFTTLSGQSDACQIQVPLKLNADGTCP